MVKNMRHRKRDFLRDLLTGRDKPASNPAIPSQSSVPSSPQAAPPPQAPGSQSSSSTQPGSRFSEDALQTLTSDEQALMRRHLAENVGNITEAVRRAYDAASEQKRVCEDKRWRVNFRGREIILRDEAERAVHWIERFKSVGDVIANVDPIHVGLPWAGIRMILEVRGPDTDGKRRGKVGELANCVQVAVADSRQMAALLNGMNLVMYMANRLRAYWDFFNRLPNAPTTVTFETALLKMYVLVLQFLDGAVESCRKGSAARAWIAVWQESELDAFEGRCKEWAVQVEIDASNCDRELHQQDRDGLSKWREDLETTLQILARRIENRRLTERAETPPLPTSTVPFLRDPDFVDRQELSILEQKLSTAGTRVALVGLGGVGKSQLAIEYCYRVREQSPDTWTLWVHASSAARFDESIRKLADDVKIAGRKDAKADIYQLVHDWLCDRRKGRWVLVLDNADDTEFLFESPNGKNIRDESGNRAVSSRARVDYLPVCIHGSVLVTSRNRAVAARIVDERNSITIQPMNEEHALVLLKKKLEQHKNPTALRRLAKVLEYMPLAIAQAAAYIKNRAPRCSVEQYLDEFEKNDKSRISLLDTNSTELRRDREAASSVMITWQISFEHIYAFRRSAADLLSLMSFFDYQSIPESLLRVETANRFGLMQRHSQPSDGDNNHDGNSYGSDDDDDDAKDFEDNVLILRNYHFVSVTPDTYAFAMHRLVQLAARKWLKSQKQYQRWAEQSIRNLDLILPTGEYENWEMCRTLYPHARMTLDLKPKVQITSLRQASVLYKAAWFAWRQGLAAEAEVLASPSRDVRRSISGDNDKDTLSSESMLACILQDQGKYAAAEKMNRRALEGMEKVLGTDHPHTLTSVSNLAGVLQAQGKHAAAEEMHLRALEGREKVLGAKHLDTLTSVGNLAGVLQAQGKYAAAEEMNRRALEGEEKVLGAEHPDTLMSVSNLTLVLQAQGKYAAAEEMNRRALEGMEKVLGAEHPSTLTSVGNLAGVLQAQGKHAAAEEMNRRALEGREKVLSAEHPDTLMSVSNLALVLQAQGKYAAAEEMNRRALEGKEKVLGAEHPSTLTSIWVFASLRHKQGEYDAAINLYKQAYEGFVKALGVSHPTTIQCLNGLSSLQAAVSLDLSSTTDERG